MKHWKWYVCALLIALLALGTVAACGDDDDDDDRPGDDDDDDQGDPASYIVTSDYGGNRYHVINGDTFFEYDPVFPEFAEDTNGLSDATFVPNLLTGDLESIFVSIPTGYGSGQLFCADALTGAGAVKMTDIDNPGMGDIVGAGPLGILFIAVDEVGNAIPEIRQMQLTDTEAAYYKGEDFQKLIAGDLCSTWVSGFEALSYAPGGSAIGTGWHCKHKEDGSDLKAYTTVLAFDPEDGDCGDPLMEREGGTSVRDTCFSPDGDWMFWSVGLANNPKEVFAGHPGDPDSVVDVSASFLAGEFSDFDCDPTSLRFVVANISVRPDLYVIEAEDVDGELTFSAPVRITDTTTSQDGYRNPKWVKSE